MLSDLSSLSLPTIEVLLSQIPSEDIWKSHIKLSLYTYFYESIVNITVHFLYATILDFYSTVQTFRGIIMFMTSLQILLVYCLQVSAAETTHHYLLECPRLNSIRQKWFPLINPDNTCTPSPALYFRLLVVDWIDNSEIQNSILSFLADLRSYRASLL